MPPLRNQPPTDYELDCVFRALNLSFAWAEQAEARSRTKGVSVTPPTLDWLYTEFYAGRFAR